MSLESLSFCLYTLVMFKIKNKLTAEAGIKYFCLGALASGFMLFGIALIYGVTNTISFSEIKYCIDFSKHSNINSSCIYIGFLLLLAGFFFKLGLFPYHMGLLDIYDGSSLSTTLFLVTVVKFSIIIILSKILMFVFYSLQKI